MHLHTKAVGLAASGGRIEPLLTCSGIDQNACQTSRTLNGSWGNIGMSVMHGAEKSLCAMVRQHGFLVLRIKTIAFRVSM